MTHRTRFLQLLGELLTPSAIPVLGNLGFRRSGHSLERKHSNGKSDIIYFQNNTTGGAISIRIFLMVIPAYQRAAGSLRGNALPIALIRHEWVPPEWAWRQVEASVPIAFHKMIAPSQGWQIDENSAALVASEWGRLAREEWASWFEKNSDYGYLLQLLLHGPKESFKSLGLSEAARPATVAVLLWLLDSSAREIADAIEVDPAGLETVPGLIDKLRQQTDD